ncbi:MAG: type II toxin-antitoxin system VapC family toxin [Dehalococcoidia bacterium]
MRAVFDTNILVDIIQGVPEAREELRRYRDPSASVVTWIELMVGARAINDEEPARRLLNRLDIRPLTPEVAEQATTVRLVTRLKLPDAVIWATARAMNCVLVTRNTRDFPAGDPMIRVPYTL